MEITEQPWAEWMEQNLRELQEYQPAALCMAAVLKDGTVLTTYFHCSIRDREAIAGSIQADTTMKTILANIEHIKRALEELEDQ